MPVNTDIYVFILNVEWVFLFMVFELYTVYIMYTYHSTEWMNMVKSAGVGCEMYAPKIQAGSAFRSKIAGL